MYAGVRYTPSHCPIIAIRDFAPDVATRSGDGILPSPYPHGRSRRRTTRDKAAGGRGVVPQAGVRARTIGSPTQKSGARDAVASYT